MLAVMDPAIQELRARASRLRQEALALLAGGTRAVLEAALGPVTVAGSVALDLMVWPDLDLYARVEAGERGRLVGLVAPLAAQLERQGYPLARLALRDEHRRPDPAFPDSPGLYLGLECVGPGDRPWTIDLWGWDGTRHALQAEAHARLARGLERADRDLVLRIKEAARAQPGYRSVDVYAFATAGAGTSYEDFERFRRGPGTAG